MKTITALTLAATATVHASTWLEGDYLTGDWKGERTKLEESGVKYFGYYNAIFAGNVSGGNSTDSSYAGDLFTGVEFDLEKIAGWDDTTFVLSGVDRHGRSIDDAVGGQYSVMQLVGGQNAFLYNVTLEKKFLDDTLAFKIGRMSATDDFVGSPYFSYSLSNAVNGQIRACLFDGVMTSYPFPVWGARLKYQPNDEFYIMLGAFQLTENIFDREQQGVDFTFHGDDGISIFTQVGWNPKIAERPAHFYLGTNMAFDDINQYNTTEDVNHFVRFYGNADYQVYAESPGSDEGLVLFSTFAWTAQEEVAIMDFQSTFGANYKGLFPGREDDHTVFFATYGGFGDSYADEQVSSGDARPDYEMVLELGHRFQLSKFAYIQPHAQYVIQPGGTGNIDNALVLGFQYGLTF